MEQKGQEEMNFKYIYKYLLPKVPYQQISQVQGANKDIVNNQNQKPKQQQQQPKQKEEEQKKPKNYQLEEDKDEFENMTHEQIMQIKLSKQIASKYLPKSVEREWDNWWQQQGFFKSDPTKVLEGKKKAYTLCLPPPNVTGYLHIGHGLTNAVEDCIIRRKRMQGYETLYLPGSDHAGIATHTVVEKDLMKKLKLTRHQIGREKFVEYIWEWVKKHGDQIFYQLRRLGGSFDYSRKRFTMDEMLSKAVIEAFVRFHEQGLIYRANRLVNWSCKLLTAISDIEVEYQELEKPIKIQVPGHDGYYEFGYLTHFAYKLKEDPTQSIEIATTRLETMLGDVAVAVNSKDPRYTKFHGKQLIHPFIPNRNLFVICDDILVDMNFGTGAVKVTPGHDQNDYTTGQRHNLEVINIFNDDGTLNDNAGPYKGLKRYDVRVQLEKDLTKLGQFRGKVENPKQRIAFCSRSKDIVEPMLRPQWYVKTQAISKRMEQAMKNCKPDVYYTEEEKVNVINKDEKLVIYPEEFEKVWDLWLSNPRDWCISRQLWWGHRIPAYIVKLKGSQQKPDDSDEKNWVVARSYEEALVIASKQFNVPQDQLELLQDEDVLDTWFSSGLFPFSTMGWPDEKNLDFKAFFPNAILETGHDILFFWVARMVMMSLLLTDKLPFTTVFLHPIIRDSEGRKMSKSLGNVIDPLEIIDGTSLESLIQKLKDGNLDPRELAKGIEQKKKEYPEGIPRLGSDSLRFTLLAYMQKGKYINLDIMRIIGYREWGNKIWQTVNFGKKYLYEGFQYDDQRYQFKDLQFTNRWILHCLNDAVKNINHYFDSYDFGDAINAFQQYWRYEFCDVYIEAIKPYLYPEQMMSKEKDEALNTLMVCLDYGLRLLHPMMPFMSEELYQKLPDFKKKSKTIVFAEYPEHNKDWIDSHIVDQFKLINDCAKSIRQVLSNMNIPQNSKNKPESFATIKGNQNMKEILTQHGSLIATLSKTSSFKIVEDESQLPKGCAQSAANSNIQIYVNVQQHINKDAEIQRLEKNILESQNFIELWKQKINPKLPDNKKLDLLKKIEEKEKELQIQLEALQNIKSL